MFYNVPGDTSLRNPIAKHGSYEGFISYTVNEIRNYTDRKIVVRSPISRRLWQLEIIENVNLKGITISENILREGMLSAAMNCMLIQKDAWAVVGFNSNALTESVCEGIPTFSMCLSQWLGNVPTKRSKLIEQS